MRGACLNFTMQYLCLPIVQFINTYNVKKTDCGTCSSIGARLHGVKFFLHAVVPPPPESIVRQQISRMEENIFLYERRINRDTSRLDELGRRWAENRRRPFVVRAFRLEAIVRDAIVDYV
jgi:hypothetical protein